MDIKMYEVGGCVRDGLLGVKTKDIDFAVEAPSFDAMRQYLLGHGFEIFLESPDYLTIRARFGGSWEPGMPKYIRPFELGRMTADFVLCRKDGEYTDGRRPDTVEPGTIYDDLARRDFTVNAIARDWEGNLIDPHGGQSDLDRRVLKCVGDPRARLTEDALRALRAIRFRVTKDLAWSPLLAEAMFSDWLPPLLTSVSLERIREEMHKTFRANTLLTLDILQHDVSAEMTEAIFRDGLWLAPSMKE